MRKHSEDYQLVHQYLCRDEAAGQKLYSKTLPLLKKYVVSRTKGSALDSHDIDDIIMESLKRSIEKLERYDGSSEFASWVIGIAKFVIMEQLRKKTKNTLLEDMPDAEFDHIISLFSVDPLFVILNKEIHDAIIAAINQLSPEHQQIIQLRLFNKVSFEQISEISKKSESAIYSLYSRALKSLRKILKEKL